MKFILLITIIVFSNCTLAEDSSIALAKRLYIALDEQSNFDAMADNLGQMMANQIGTDDIPEEARSFVEKKFTEFYSLFNSVVRSEELELQYIKTISETYSKDELESAVAFFESAAGKAYTARSPQLLESQLAIIQPVIADITERMGEIMEEISTELSKY